LKLLLCLLFLAKFISLFLDPDSYYASESHQHIERTKSASPFLHSYQSNSRLFPSKPSMSYSLLVIHELADSPYPALLSVHNLLYSQDSSSLSSHSLHLLVQALFSFSHVSASRSLDHR